MKKNKLSLITLITCTALLVACGGNSSINTSKSSSGSNSLESSDPASANPSSSYDDLAAFLSDVQTAGDTAVTRFTRKINRTCDAVDSSRILKFYAKRSSADYESMTNKQIWDIVDKIAPDPNANKEAQEKAQDEA